MPILPNMIINEINNPNAFYGANVNPGLILWQMQYYKFFPRKSSA